MYLKRLAALLLGVVIIESLLVGCGGNAGNGGNTAALTGDSNVDIRNGEIIDFTMFAAMPGSEINDGNEIQEIIAQKTGVRVKETWLTGQTASEAVGTIIAGGDYPDFIDGGDAMKALYDAEALVAWDDYLDKYPNLKEMYSDKEWDKFRMDDGKIYWANVFGNSYGEDKSTTHGEEAFWVQVKVLEWAGYPKIETLDQYFDLLTSYVAENPVMDDGTTYIPYTILCEDWRYFCIENAPEFLDGYPNDGSVIVDVDNMKIIDYNTTPTAEKYFRKLNEEYNKGTVDPEFATQTYDEYIGKLSTGRVLGMCDQWWNFAYTINDVFKQQGLDLTGCNYVPLGLTINAGMENRWHSYGDILNNSSGIAVTKNCSDVEAAFKFMNDLLDQEIHDLRYWGVEGVDYLVDGDGLYYRTEEQRANAADTEYKASHICAYSYFPQWLGTSKDGKNAMQPPQQTSEFFNGLAEPLVKCFEAYGVGTYVEMVDSAKTEMGPWYPMYSFSNAMTTETPGGVAWTKMGEVKHEWLPMVVMASDFDSAWSTYMDNFNAAKPEDFIAEMQEELERRVEAAKE